MRNKTAVGIDIGSSQIKVVAMELANGSKPKILGYGSALSQGLKRGEIMDQRELAASLKNCLQKCQDSSGFPVEEAYLAVDGENLKSFRAKGVAIVSRADGEITEYDIERAIETAKGNLGQLMNREIIHAIAVSFKIDDNFQTQNPIGLKAMRLDVGGTTMALSVFEEGVPISMEILPIGSDHISHDLAIGFQISLEEAENLKTNILNKNWGREEKRKLDEIIEARFSDIFELVDRHLRKIGRHGLLPSGVILTGGGANMPGLSEYAKKFLKLPSNIYLPREEYDSSDESLYLPQWSSAIGLCFWAMDDLREGKRFAFSPRPSFVLKWLRTLLP